MAKTQITCPTDAGKGAVKEYLDEMLLLALHEGASDIHLIAHSPPYFRNQGVMSQRKDYTELSPEDTEGLAELLADRGELDLTRLGSIDGAISVPGGTRFRFNISQSQNGASIAFRRLENRFWTLAELGLPETLYDICELHEGLVIVAGPTGCGKSTTLATLLDRINETRVGHIVTIEDPVEYLHKPKKCAVNQRQVGSDVRGFNEALVAAMRQDPDVILVGEIRDEQTVRTAIMAAETGHLVFTTVHAANCQITIERLISVFPSHEQDGIRGQLSLVLRGVIAQHLRIADGPVGKLTVRKFPEGEERRKQRLPKERVLISEIMIGTPAVANLIAKGQTAQLYHAIEAGRAHGMHTLDDDLARLWLSNQISRQTALAVARSPRSLDERVATMRRDKEYRTRT